MSSDTSPSECSLEELISTMQPTLQGPAMVFVTLPPGTQCPAYVQPIMTFREVEGQTLILTAAEAQEAGLPSTYVCRMITLNVHASLEAIGFLAAITARLAKAKLSVNPVSAYYHDHLFVPQDRAREALNILREMAATAQQSLTSSSMA